MTVLFAAKSKVVAVCKSSSVVKRGPRWWNTVCSSA